MDELVGVSQKWYSIGLKLKVPPGTLDNIEYKELDAPTSLRKMLACWLKGTDSPPTWDTLANALESRAIGEAQLGQQLRLKYCAGKYSQCELGHG